MTVFYSRAFVCVAASALAALTPAAFAQASEPETITLRTGPQPEPIIVEGQKPLDKKDARAAVRDLAMRGRSHLKPLAKYSKPLCLSVAGLGERYNTQVADRVKQNATDAEIPIADADCKTNAAVVVVKNPEKLIKRLRKVKPRLVSMEANHRIRDSRARGDAYYAWSQDRVGRPGGGRAVERGEVAGAAGTALFGNPGFTVPTNRILGTSKFTISYSIQRRFSIIIFDVERLGGVHLNQLADFATMRLLTEPQPTVELENARTDSILTLFDVDPESAPPVMTQLDRAYLRGLYKMRPNEKSSRLERFVLAELETMQSGAMDDGDCRPEGAADCAITP
ncbi:MAG: hypothetical protein AAF127_11380 [Pseudomonadota bacterium]